MEANKTNDGATKVMDKAVDKSSDVAAVKQRDWANYHKLYDWIVAMMALFRSAYSYYDIVDLIAPLE